MEAVIGGTASVGGGFVESPQPEIETRRSLRTAFKRKRRNTMRFPLFIELEGKSAAVIGGGTIGTRRACALAEYGAAVTVIAPEISEPLRELVQKGQIRWKRKQAEADDLEGAVLAVTAADDREVNHRAVLWCRERGIPVNAADRKEECDFYFPGLARKDEIIVGVCAGGKDHKKAKTVTEAIRSLLKEKEETER